MPPYRIELYEDARGRRIVADDILALRRISNQTWQAIRQRLELLERSGPDPNLDSFKLLRHTGGRDIWELRAGRRPAYRLIFAQMPGRDAFLVMSVIRKEDMARNGPRFIGEAIERLQDWIRRQPGDPRNNLRSVD